MTRYGPLFSLLQESSIILSVIVLALDWVDIGQKFLFGVIFGHL